MKFKILGFTIIIEKEMPLADRLLRVADKEFGSVSRINLIKAMRMIDYKIGLIEARNRIDELFDFVIGMPVRKK